MVERFKKEKNIRFHFETSAKTGENIENLFILASKILYHNFKDKITQMVSSRIFNPLLLTFPSGYYRSKMQWISVRSRSRRSLTMPTVEEEVQVDRIKDNIIQTVKTIRGENVANDLNLTRICFMKYNIILILTCDMFINYLIWV
jgi:hypothetical protein